MWLEGDKKRLAKLVHVNGNLLIVVYCGDLPDLTAVVMRGG
jgi:hypothetical protein